MIKYEYYEFESRFPLVMKNEYSYHMINGTLKREIYKEMLITGTENFVPVSESSTYPGSTYPVWIV